MLYSTDLVCVLCLHGADGPPDEGGPDAALPVALVDGQHGDVAPLALHCPPATVIVQLAHDRPHALAAHAGLVVTEDGETYFKYL